MGRNRSDVQRVGSLSQAGSVSSRKLPDSADAVVIERAILGHVENERSAAFERSGISLVACTVVIEHSVTGANGGLAVAMRIVGESDARRGVEEVTTHATVGNPIHSTSHKTIRNPRIEAGQVQWDGRAVLSELVTRARDGEAACLRVDRSLSSECSVKR